MDTAEHLIAVHEQGLGYLPSKTLITSTATIGVGYDYAPV